MYWFLKIRPLKDPKLKIIIKSKIKKIEKNVRILNLKIINRHSKRKEYQI